MRKAQGLSISTIVIAAIALLVLVVLGIIFVGKMGNWRRSSDACDNAGGTCSLQPCSQKYPNDPYVKQTSDPCDLDRDGTYEDPIIDGYCCVSI